MHGLLCSRPFMCVLKCLVYWQRLIKKWLHYHSALSHLSAWEKCFIIILDWQLAGENSSGCLQVKKENIYTQEEPKYNISQITVYITYYCTVLRTIRHGCHVSNLAPLLTGLKPAPNGWQYQYQLFAQNLSLAVLLHFGALYCFYEPFIE